MRNDDFHLLALWWQKQETELITSAGNRSSNPQTSSQVATLVFGRECVWSPRSFEPSWDLGLSLSHSQLSHPGTTPRDVLLPKYGHLSADPNLGPLSRLVEVSQGIGVNLLSDRRGGCLTRPGVALTHASFCTYTAGTRVLWLLSLQIHVFFGFTWCLWFTTHFILTVLVRRLASKKKQNFFKKTTKNSTFWSTSDQKNYKKAHFDWLYAKNKNPPKNSIFLLTLGKITQFFPNVKANMQHFSNNGV